MDMNTYTSMKNEELVAAWNTMVENPLIVALGNPRYKRTERFASANVGMKKCELLESTIRALGSAPKEKEEASQEGATEPKENKPVETVTKKKVVSKKNGNGAAKAVKKKVAAVKVEKAALALPSNTKGGAILESFQPRAGTVREKVLVELIESRNKSIPVVNMLKAAYGNMKEENTTALGMVLKGVRDMIDLHKLKFELKRDGRGKDVTYGLYSTE